MSIHYFISPIRTIIGHVSDRKRIEGRWRTPFIILGTMLTFGGLTTAPFSLVLFSPDSVLKGDIVYVICVAIFIVYGVGINIVETTYLALVGDITTDQDRGKLIAVLQGSSVVFVVCTIAALYDQERLRPDGTLVNDIARKARYSLKESLIRVWNAPTLRSLFFVFFVATLGFGTHDILLEPYGAEILQMSVTATTFLTALWGIAMIFAIVIAGLWLWRGGSSARLIIAGGITGMLGFGLVTISGYLNVVGSFQLGVATIGIGRGLFIVGSIATVMSLADRDHTGLFLGIWGVVQSLAQGFGTIGGGVARDIIKARTNDALLGYVSVYGVAGILLIIMVLYMLISRIGRKLENGDIRSPWSGLQDIPADQLLY
jgi:BCD family chlorophyll transporter-like MFS transporter